ncbi:hypothetical protein [Chitinasiproducens palmae]|uniref:Uncharacterized protein n=1 Tax=Chitinasiproducens palmae TaxID=1770053 RepID=A0A1H2PNX3_9BURK|nr:hypothetical protein [Chitinasiproducens palmae]SDV47940.1 hypothetical protein SAMN05216551_10417 [Chitinasiproducens palmae]
MKPDPFTQAMPKAPLAEEQDANKQANQWRALFCKVAIELNCLPSMSIDGNEHVLRAAREYGAPPVEQAAGALTGDLGQLIETVKRRDKACGIAANTPGADYFDASTNMLIAVRALVAKIETAPAQLHQSAISAGNDTLVSPAARDVLAERRRQIEVEGRTPEEDDLYDRGQMATAAGCYAMFTKAYPAGDPSRHWPWSSEWWKPTTPRRNLVKAGALILAEIERLDRAALAARNAESKARQTDGA